MARTDARATHGLDEALWRARAFADAGADLLFVEAPRDEREMERVVRERRALPQMANLVEGGDTPLLPPARLEALGYRIAAYPLTLLSAADARDAARARARCARRARPTICCRSPSCARWSASITYDAERLRYAEPAAPTDGGHAVKIQAIAVTQTGGTRACCARGARARRSGPGPGADPDPRGRRELHRRLLPHRALPAAGCRSSRARGRGRGRVGRRRTCAVSRAGDRVAWSSVPGLVCERRDRAGGERRARAGRRRATRSRAAAMLQGMTAHYLVHGVRETRPGDVALVHAAAGGAGLLLVQLLRPRARRWIGTCSTAEKEALARAAGADHVIRYSEREFAPALREWTRGRGADVVYDSVGRTTFEGSLASLRPRGLLVLFGQSSGPVPPFDLGAAQRDGLAVRHAPVARALHGRPRRARAARGRGVRRDRRGPARRADRRRVPARARRRRAPRARGPRDHGQGAAARREPELPAQLQLRRRLRTGKRAEHDARARSDTSRTARARGARGSRPASAPRARPRSRPPRSRSRRRRRRAPRTGSALPRDDSTQVLQQLARAGGAERRHAEQERELGAASRARSPSSTPPAIVIIERDVPGHIAGALEQPDRERACATSSDSSRRARREPRARSSQIIQSPPANSAREHRHRLEQVLLDRVVEQQAEQRRRDEARARRAASRRRPAGIATEQAAHHLRDALRVEPEHREGSRRPGSRSRTRRARPCSRADSRPEQRRG